MKSMWESSEAFTAYATIESGYLVMDKLNRQYPLRSGLTKAIDIATGYDIKIERDIAIQIVPILRDIIRAKKFIGCDYSNDEKMLLISQNVLNNEQKVQASVATDDAQ